MVRTTVLLGTVLCCASAYAANTFPPHQGDSPWSFSVIAEPSDTFVVNDRESATIDRYLFRSEGPIVIDVRVRRYVAPTDANGYLLNVNDLIARGVVAQYATIQLPAFDVDELEAPLFDCDGDGIDDQLRPELDELYLNDEKLGPLKGNNQIWLAQSFRVPIQKIKFPSQPGQTATNRIRVEIDVANRDVVLSSGAVGCETWAVAVDWVGAKYQANSPVILVHGIRSSGAVWGPFREGLTAARVESDASINLVDVAAPATLPAGCPNIPYNNSIQNNLRQLSTLIPQIATRYGTDSIQLAVHSKGGLDSLAFLSSSVSVPFPVTVGTMAGTPVRRDLEAFSLVTLNTPHRGSILAQFGVEGRQLTNLQALRHSLNIWAAKRFEGSYYCDLTPARASTFVGAASLPSVTKGASVATDADRNGDGQLTLAQESEGFGLDSVATRLYRLTGGVQNVTVTITQDEDGDDVIRVTETPTAAFLENDAIVTTASAARYVTFGIDGWNHLNVHARVNADEIAREGQAPGIIDWRAR
jgi:hypothetical protein